MMQQNSSESRNMNLFGDIFLYNEESSKSICQLLKNGDKCGKQLATKKAFNLKRHIRLVHPDFEGNIIENKDFHNYMSNEYILNCCVEMLTINGRPFSSLSDSGFLKLVNPLLDIIKKSTGENISIGMEKVKNQMKIIDEKIREQIMKETKNTLISVMIDIATRCNRAFLGINIQYMLKSRIVVRTLKLLRLTESHTGKSLSKAVIDTLKEFNISIKQIYSQTTDNGSNVLLSTKLLEELAEAEKNACGEDTLTIEQIEEEFYVELLKQAEQEFFQSENVADFVNKLTCGEHNFQLAFKGALKISTTTSSLICKVKNVARKLRTPNILNVLREKKLNFPLLDNDTRWTGKYTMVRVFTKNICIHTDISVYSIYYKHLFICVQ